MFLVCGEAVMDVFESGRTPTGVQLDARMGGSPFNVAVGLARLGQPAALLTSLSRGFLGERLWQALVEEGVSTAAIQRVDAPTTLSLVNLNAQGLPSYSFYGEGGADRVPPGSDGAALPAGVRAMHFGSFTTVVEPVATFLRGLVSQRNAGATLVSFDPNVRLNVVPDDARWREALNWMLPRTDLLKISDEDLSLLYPAMTPRRFARKALDAGVRLVVVTLGDKGSLGWTARHGPVESPCGPLPQLVDSVGAGDTFQAALLTWLAEEDVLERGKLAQLTPQQVGEALAFASHAAALTCSRRGADLPRRDELPRRP